MIRYILKINNLIMILNDLNIRSITNDCIETTVIYMCNTYENHVCELDTMVETSYRRHISMVEF